MHVEEESVSRAKLETDTFGVVRLLVSRSPATNHGSIQRTNTLSPTIPTRTVLIRIHLLELRHLLGWDDMNQDMVHQPRIRGLDVKARDELDVLNVRIEQKTVELIRTKRGGWCVGREIQEKIGRGERRRDGAVPCIQHGILADGFAKGCTCSEP